MERLTTDKPSGNTETMLNYARVGEDHRVKLAYGNGQEDIDLCEYIEHEASEYYCHPTADEILDGMCFEECDCIMAILNTVATQAAELRERLKLYEDTGLMPEEVLYIKHAIMGKVIAGIKEFEGVPVSRMRELATADKDGHLVVTPCKVGDDVYFLIPDDMADGGIYVSYPHRVTEVGTRGFWTSGFCGDPDGMDDFISWKELGKSVFLTLEEADVELSSMRGRTNGGQYDG